ncbi:MAG: universal stress protein [Paracoccaceae bacterium]|nr:universal stress protein [Paracoccaceae bacterium]
MFKSILLPVDLNAEASWAKAAPIAVKMARDDGIPLHVATVVPDFGASMVSVYFEEGFEEKALHHAGEELNAWVEKHIPDGVEVHPHVLHGRVYDEIMRAADSLEVDAIVMGSHRPELKDYLLGPNAARVVRHANQSVFVVRGNA